MDFRILKYVRDQKRKQAEEAAKKGMVWMDASVPSVETGSAAATNASGEGGILLDEQEEEELKKRAQATGFLGGVSNTSSISL